MSRLTKIKLEKKDDSRSLVKGLLSVVIVVFGLYMFYPYLSYSGAEDFKVDDPVGNDLLLTNSSERTIESVEHQSQENTNSSPFPRMNQYQIDSVTPTETKDRLIFKNEDTLKFGTHTVQNGENLWKIAQKYGLKTYSLVSVNYDRLKKKNVLPIGFKLRIPNRNGVMTKLKSGQTLWDLMRSYDVSHKKILAFNDLDSPGDLHTGQDLFIPTARPVNPYKYRLFQGGTNEYIWPVTPARRRVTSGFGDREHPIYDREIFHRGIDIAARKGTVVFASRAGVVEFVGTIDGYGKTVTISHGDSTKTVYSHLNRHFVRKNQYLEQGQRIGEIGRSGLATAPNLHFEIRNDEKALDPIKHLP